MTILRAFLLILSIALFNMHFDKNAYAASTPLRATYSFTADGTLGPQTIARNADLQPVSAFNYENSPYLWILYDLKGERLSGDQSVLLARGLRSRLVEVFVQTTDNNGWQGPYPLGEKITAATHPADTTMVHLPNMAFNIQAMAIKLSQPSRDVIVNDISLATLEEANNEDQKLAILYGIVLIIVTVALFYNGFLYTIYRQKFQTFYIYYTLALLIYTALTSSWIGPVNDIFDGAQQYEIRAFFYSLMAMGIYLFAAEITKEEFSKPFTSALRVASVLPVCVILLGQIFDEASGFAFGVAFDVAGVAGILIYFAGAAIAIPKGGRTSLLVLIAFLVPSMALFIKIGAGYYGIAQSFWIHNSVVIGTAIENILMALILIERLLGFKQTDTIDNTL